MDDFVWTEEKDNFLRDNYTEMSYAKMGEVLGIPFRYRNRVLRRCEKLGLRRYSGREFNEKFFDQWTNNMAYMLGYFCADGSMSYDERHNDLVFRCSEKDRELLERIRQLLEVKKPLNYNEKTKSVSLGLSSKYLCQKLISLGLKSNKSREGFNVDIPRKYLNHFVRGYFDGDGNVSEDVRRGYSVRYRLYTSIYCRDFLYKLNDEIVSEIGVKTHMRETSNGLICLEVSARDARRFMNWLYYDAEIFLARKYKNKLKEEV